MKPRGPSESQVLKTRSMDELIGIEALQFGDGIGEVFTPKTSIQQLQQQSDIRHTFNEWLDSIHRHSNHQKSSSQEVISKHPIFHEIESIDDHDNVIVKSDDMNVLEKDVVQIEFEDIKEEVEFWNSAVVCYVMGANPPIHIMEGFVHRIWRNLKVDKVAMIHKGVFIVRFTSMENRDKALTGHFFFDNKPLILKPWVADMDFMKEDLKSVPVWIQLKLNLKYWGEKALYKIVEQIGKPIQRDEATKNCDKVQFARVLVEVSLSEKLLNYVEFRNEYGDKMEVEVKYEWRPVICKACQCVGHEAEQCRVKKKQVWRAKEPMKSDVRTEVVVADVTKGKEN